MVTALCVKNKDPRNNEDFDLIVGKEYEVERIMISQTSTSIILKQTDGIYNSVCFEFFENNLPLDIYKDRRFNPYIPPIM